MIDLAIPITQTVRLFGGEPDKTIHMDHQTLARIDLGVLGP